MLIEALTWTCTLADCSVDSVSGLFQLFIKGCNRHCLLPRGSLSRCNFPL